MPITLDGSKDEIARLVRHFATNLAQYRAPGYKEANARQEFIDPLFAALGWDVSNIQHAAPDYREVVVEPSLDVEGHQKAPDYAFRIGREAKFYVEAKKPGVDLKVDPGPAYQLRRYAWTARLPLSVLTDFEEFAVYDCRKRPSDHDKPAVARTDFYTFEEYPDCWPKIWEVFSRDAVLGGAFDKAAGGAARRGASEVDAEFLKEIEGWRDVLARNFALRNPRLTVDELNDAVQKTIDRIVFLRMAEDRGMEEYGRLQRLAEVGGTYTGLIRIARLADDKYNSGLFDFSRDKLTPHLSLDDKALAAILKSLYFPQSPYAFRVLPPEILGSVYERFLGKVIRLTAGHQAKVEEKPEVRKAGGVYYTPGYIVDYIVEQTVTKQIAGKSPAQLRGYRVLDMACGSGSFLVGAYRTLLDHYLRWYSENEPERHAKAVYAVAIAGYDTSLPLSGGGINTLSPQGRGQGVRGDDRERTPPPFPPPGKAAGPRSEAEGRRAYRLTTAEKKRILTEHIFGVDIDRQAVEVTKLSLLLQVLEGETDETLGKQMRLLHDRALPDLDHNIQCGNSLIGPDYFSGRLLPDAEELARVNAFDWKAAFPEAMAVGGFDAVIGNPPYVLLGKDIVPPTALDYLSKYRVAAYKMDTYHLFIERALLLLRTSGLLGFITPSTWYTLPFTKALREHVLMSSSIEQMVVFDHRVFADADVATGLIFLRKGTPEPDHLVAIKITSEAFQPQDLHKARTLSMPQAEWLGDQQMRLDFRIAGPEGAIAKRLSSAHPQLVELARASLGIQAYNSSKHTPEQISKRVFHASRKISHEYLPELAGSDVGRYFIDRKKGQWIRYGPWLHDYRTMDWLSGPRLLIREIAGPVKHRIQASYTEDTYCNYKTILNVNPSDKTTFSMKYVLGILNSRLSSFLYPYVASKLPDRSFPRLSVADMRRLPVRPINFSDPADKAHHDKMVALVERMLELHKRKQAAGSDHERQLLQRQIDSTDGEIDALVYELYGLTDEEIRIVEGSPSPQPSPLQGEGV